MKSGAVLSGQGLGAASGLEEYCKPYFRQAIAAGVPPFLTAERASTPINASPYVGTLPLLKECLRHDAHRLALLEALDLVGAEVRTLGCRIQAVLVGGSFVRLADPKRPNDLDCVAFYVADADWNEESAYALQQIQRAAHQRRVDIRFCPMDSDPLLLMKTVSFFSTLYAKKEGDLLIRNGLLLLVDVSPQR